MMKVSVSHHFSAGHRILGLTGPAAKCANLHGHTFGVCATFEQPGELAVEFTTVKGLLRGWIDQYLDHGYLVGTEDLQLLQVLQDLHVKHYVLPTWPTTEAIAQLIADQLGERVAGARLCSVQVTEGPHNSATWTAE